MENTAYRNAMELLARRRSQAEKDAAELTVTVTPSPRTKCIRCWHYVDGTTEDAEHPGLCPRCRVNLFGAGEKRLYA